MFLNSLLGLTSISQWALFVGIAFILFGWIEKKENFVLAGQLVLLLLGFLAFYILLNEGITVPNSTGNPLPKELKILIFFKWTAIFTGFNAVSILLRLFKVRFYKISLFILILFALMLFFMVFSIQQIAN
jgi:hypothetical protein